MRQTLLYPLVLFSFFTTRAANIPDTDSLVPPRAIKEKIGLFPLGDIRILDGPFRKIMDLDHRYLLSLDPDKLLSWFRREAGLAPKAPPYPGWESEPIPGNTPLSGHILGFYLSSMAMMYASTGDPKIIAKLDYVLAELDRCQKAGGDGYVMATPNGRHLFEDVARGNFVTTNPFINNYWEPVYVLNKIMLGLDRVYLDCRLPLAKTILVRAANWFGDSVIDKLDHDQMQKLLFCEHGSINESFVNVYQLTGEEKYLQWARRLNDEKMWIPLSQGRDILDGWHANTQIPKFTGFETIYDYTGDRSFTDAAVFFWNTIVKNRSWVIGGNSTAEHFFPRSAFDEKVEEPGGPESCNSVNMMRLTEALYRDDAEPAKVDYYERVLFNHILANYNPRNGMCVYYTTMRPGHYKVYSSPYRSFWCCTGTGMEAPAKFGQMIYAYKADELYVNLFIHSSLHWKGKSLEVEQETKFPAENATRLTIQTSKPMAMNLLIRRPRWMDTTTVVLRVNGALAHALVDPRGYLVVHRRWRNGDVISMEWKPILSVERLGDSDRFAAFLCGPIVLAARVDNHGLTKDDFTGTRNAFADKVIPMSEAPAFTDSWQTALAGLHADSAENRHTSSAALLFILSVAGGRTIRLEPFYQIAFSRYAVYFQHFDAVKVP